MGLIIVYVVQLYYTGRKWFSKHGTCFGMRAVSEWLQEYVCFFKTHTHNCFIPHELMRDPVSTANDQTQERDAIARWLRTKQTTDPISNVLLANKKLAPNFALRVVIA